MTMPMIDPEQPFHLQKTPEEWQKIQDQAVADHRRNPHDDEAMKAIRDSNEALNAYDQPAIEAGKHVLSTGWGDPVEALKGEAEGVGGAVAAPFHLANTLYRHGASAGIDEMINGLTSIPGEVMSGDPRRIGNVAGNIAGGIAMGKVGGKLGKGVKGVISDYAERPTLKNNLLKAQVTALQQGLAKSSATMPDAIEQAGLKTDTMRQNLDQRNALHPDAVEQAGLKTNRLHQDVAEKAGTLHDDVAQAKLKTDKMVQDLTKGQQDISRGAGSLDATTERPGLQNELTRLQIEKLRKFLDDMNNEEGDAGPSGSAPVEPPPPTVAPTGNSAADAARNEHLASDPYGLNDVAKPPTAPPDILDNFIQSMKARTGDPSPVSPLDRTGNEAPPPMSPDALNELLDQVTKKKPKGPQS